MLFHESIGGNVHFNAIHKASSKLFNDQQICSPHSVVLQFYIILSSLYQPMQIQETAKDGMTGLQSGNIMGKEQT